MRTDEMELRELPIPNAVLRPRNMNCLVKVEGTDRLMLAPETPVTPGRFQTNLRQVDVNFIVSDGYGGVCLGMDALTWRRHRIREVRSDEVEGYFPVRAVWTRFPGRMDVRAYTKKVYAKPRTAQVAAQDEALRATPTYQHPVVS